MANETVNLDKRIFHVDMDAFFASIEQRNNPGLRNKPVIVGGDPKSRGVVSTCSYEARQYGVHSAMPMAEAIKKCPTGIIIEGDPHAYMYSSFQIKAILNRFTPKVEMVSVDEAFLEITASNKTIDNYVQIASELKKTIFAEIGVTCSVGIGPNRLIAKMASRMQKPDGLTVILECDIENKLHPLPIEKMWGIGPVTAENLKKGGIHTIGDLAAIDSEKISRYRHEQFADLIHRARGLDDQPVLDEQSQPDEKSISHEYTLPVDSDDREMLSSLLLYLAEKVVIRMDKGSWLARTIGIRIRYSNFKTITRDQTLPDPTNGLKEVFEISAKLLSRELVGRKRVRLIGIKAQNLIKSTSLNQFQLFRDQQEEKKDQLVRAINNLRGKFGNNIITRAGVMLLWRKS